MAVSDALERKIVVQEILSRPQAPLEPDRANSFDFLRFVLATFVIISHSWVILGVMNYEPLVWLTHDGISLGELAVDCFFIISGFLVSQSWQRSRNIRDFLRRRVLRIYPGFIVASLFSTFVVGALAVSNRSGYYSLSLIGKSLFCAVTLSTPHSPPGAFANLLYHNVNGSLWTIQFEFVCYLAVVVLGVAGFYRKRPFALGLFAIVWTIMLLQFRHIITLSVHQPRLDRLLSGLPYLATFFLSGACFYLYRDRIIYSHRIALLALVVVVLSLISHRFELLVMPTAGTYLLLYVAFKAPARLHSFGRRGDFSYGIYLYGWPVQMLLAWYIPDRLNPWVLFSLAFVISLLLGVLSWHLVERPCLKKKGHTGR